jgi:hypothetical protein
MVDPLATVFRPYIDVLTHRSMFSTHSKSDKLIVEFPPPTILISVLSTVVRNSTGTLETFIDAEADITKHSSNIIPMKIFIIFIIHLPN